MTVGAAFTRFPTLQTPRLHLRQVETTDTQALFTIKSNLEVTRRYGQEPHLSSLDTLGWIKRIQAGYERGEDIFWVLILKQEGKLVGACTFWNLTSDRSCAEIGYELNPEYGRQGLMHEAVSAVLDFGFNVMDFHRIEANPLADNLPSRRLLEKLSFTLEGNLRERIYFRGRFYDQLYYGMLRGEWSQSRQKG